MQLADCPFHHWRHVLQFQLHAVTTLATCNFMVMVIVLALCDADLAAQDTHLTAATGSLKRSIKYAGQLHLGEQFPHEQRVATLIAVQRGWANINPLPSKRQFTWYLLKIGKIPSERNARVYVYNWVAVQCSARRLFLTKAHIRHRQGIDVSVVLSSKVFRTGVKAVNL